MTRTSYFSVISLLVTVAIASPAYTQVSVKGDVVHTMAGESIEDGLVIIEDGKIVAVGKASELKIPDGHRVLTAEVVTPGLVDARGIVGFSGQYNQAHDQDQLDRSEPMQPELRAIDGFNARERLIEWVRDFGVTTVHTGHAPGQLISGQTLIAKTNGDTVGDTVLKERAMIAATLGEGALSGGREGGSKGGPGTRPKAVAMLRTELIKAQEYRKKRESDGEKDPPARNLRLEALADVLAGEVPLLITAQRQHDILTALRLKEEFGFDLVLDGGAEVYEVLDEVQKAGVPIFLHPTMSRAQGERENLAMDTAIKLKNAGIPFAIESGYESYVPKTRVVLFEAGIAAMYGLSPQDSLAAITIEPARILGVADRVGSIEVGKDGDLALYDGDPLEYTTHCVGVVIDGEVLSDTAH